MKNPIRRLVNCPACAARRQAISKGVRTLAGHLTGKATAGTPTPSNISKGRKP